MTTEYIFIDTETTGCRPTIDRIIDIGFYHVIDGEIVNVWQQLINPEIAIPVNIQRLTGIDNEMVENAPLFAEIASELVSMIKGKIFVAHNARFDYAFIRNELKRVGISFQAKTLCTVKLSRKLFPQEHRHNLDAIASRYNLNITTRHRALADADLLVQFFKLLPNYVSNERLNEIINKSLKEHTLPDGIAKELIEKLPETAGVYRFYGENGALLYVGKSTCIRDRVLSHFSSDHISNKEMQLSQQVKSIDYINTAGELGALLKESQLIKLDKPILNRKLRRHESLFTWELQSRPDDYHTLKVISCDDIQAHHLNSIYGLFRLKRSAEQTLRELMNEYSLCPKLLGLEKAKGACFNYQLRKCKGACVKQESAAIYNLRLEMAISGMRYQTWPYSGKIAIKEKCFETDRVDYHIIDHWCYLTTVNDLSDIYDENLIQEILGFDLDIYKLLVKYIFNKPKSVEIFELITPSPLRCEGTEGG